MNKKELLKTIREEHNDRRDKALIAASEMCDWLEERELLINTEDLQRCYLINGHKCAAIFLDYKNAIVELVPFNVQANIGTRSAGGTLRINFNL